MNIPPASIGLSTIEGRNGYFAGWGQRLLGYRPRGTNWTHAFLVLDNNEVAQAEPDGARAFSIQEYFDQLKSGDDVKFVTIDMTDQQRLDVVAAARRYVAQKTGYSWLTYVYLTLLRLHIPSEWLRKRVADSGNMLCSQLVDQCFKDGGVYLFNDGRALQNVMPGSLDEWSFTDPRAHIL